MAEFNDLTIWTDAILGDTTGLSDAEFGAYTRLLMAAWRRPECDIPDDAQWMRRTAQTPANWWPKRWAKIEGFWRRTTNSHGEPVWVQKKLLKERDRRRLFRQKQADAANVRWDQERTKKQSTGPAGDRPPPGAEQSPVTPHLLESGAELPGKGFQALSGCQRICPAHAPDSPNPVQEENTCRPSLEPARAKEGFSTNLIGKNGNGFAIGTYTVADPHQRIARFQKKLASAIGAQGWAIIIVAMNPKHPSHETALTHCKMIARTQLKKGWPRAWPLDDTLSIVPVGSA